MSPQPVVAFQVRIGAARRGQQGLAAVEAALLVLIMVAILVGLLVFWRAFQAQQILTRATGDGARAIHAMIASGLYPCDAPGYLNAAHSRALIETQVGTLVQSSLQAQMPGGLAGDIPAFQWQCSEPRHVEWWVQYRLPPLLGAELAGLLGFDESRPLTESSTVHFQQMF